MGKYREVKKFEKKESDLDLHSRSLEPLSCWDSLVLQQQLAKLNSLKTEVIEYGIEAEWSVASFFSEEGL